ncbi:hypothetical protein LIER_04063 [Lithospermum erythrorhizon]|uniref:Uncharacterized protein n=1 Tax=Lithospermum erythrorhizon TaxID=34254 RepID=A0AAV3NWL4_LITER
MYNEELYKKSWDGPLLNCMSQEDIPKVLAEVHQGWCGSHIGGETPFSLVYGTKAVLPTEVGIPTYRQLGFSEEENEQRMREQLNFVDEIRDRALYRIRVIGPGTYELEKLDGEMIPRTWHGSNLSKYYV